MDYQIFVSPIAIEQIKKQLEKRGTPDGYLRLGLTNGCNSFAYVLRFEETPKAHDLVFKINNINLLVDPKSIVYLDGATLDYESTLIKSGFIFRNPHEGKKCGCGNSFEPVEGNK